MGKAHFDPLSQTLDPYIFLTVGPYSKLGLHGMKRLGPSRMNFKWVATTFCIYFMSGSIAASPIAEGVVCTRINQFKMSFTHISGQLINEAGVVLMSIEHISNETYSLNYRNGKSILVTINSGNGEPFPLSAILPDTFWSISNRANKRLIFVCE